MKFTTPRESDIPTTDCEPVSGGSNRLRRGLVAVAVAVALPAAFATSPAAAATSPVPAEAIEQTHGGGCYVIVGHGPNGPIYKSVPCPQ